MYSINALYIINAPDFGPIFISYCIYICPMKTHHSLDVLSCGLLKVVQKCVMNVYYLGQMQCFRTKISMIDCVNIRRNVSLQFALIAFLAYTKKSQITLFPFIWEDTFMQSAIENDT